MCEIVGGYSIRATTLERMPIIRIAFINTDNALHCT
jgi:hypothetical protein